MKYLSFLAILLPILSSSQPLHSTAAKVQQATATNTSTGSIPPRPLKVGDVLPGIALDNILNYTRPKANTSDYKGKVIILDFFASWCGSCIKELPRLDSLQKLFNDSLQVLVIGYQEPGVIASFLAANKKAKSVSLPFVTGDSLLSELFPHRLLPHQVWIDMQGKVIAITQPQFATAKNLRRALDNKPMDLPLKKDIMDFDVRKPLLYQDNEESLLYSSVLMHYLNGTGSASGTTTSARGKRIYYINFPVLSLYAAALGWQNNNRILLRVKDTSVYIHAGTDDIEWSSANYYCYELQVPVATARKDINRIMLDHLNQYLHLEARIQKVTVSCWAFIKTTLPDRPVEKPGGKEGSTKKLSATLHNEPLSKLITLLNRQIPARPLQPVVLDETKDTGRVTITLYSPLHDTYALAEELKSFGYTLVPVQRELDMLVITEKN